MINKSRSMIKEKLPLFDTYREAFAAAKKVFDDMPGLSFVNNRTFHGYVQYSTGYPVLIEFVNEDAVSFRCRVKYQHV